MRNLACFLGFFALALAGPALAQPVRESVQLTWTRQNSGVSVPLRGVRAVSDQVAWASGADGTILKTTDGGETWESVQPTGVADVDFRDIEAMDDRRAWAMAAGEGRQSRLYVTFDGGERWQNSAINVDPRGFWDAIGFWDESYGILVGDPTEDSGGRFTVLTTRDGGLNWEVREGPKAKDGEALFAASGTALFARGTREAWFVTGGEDGGRVFHSEDGGDTWDDEDTPLQSNVQTAGIYSVAFRNGPVGDGVGIAVGGDYTQPDEAQRNAIRSTNGGRNWDLVDAGPQGYRSAVTYIFPVQVWIAVGPNGADLSRDDGITWEAIEDPVAMEGYNAIDFSPDGTGWAVGAEGRIARITTPLMEIE